MHAALRLPALVDKYPVVDHSFGFAIKTLERLWADQLDGGVSPEWRRLQ